MPEIDLSGHWSGFYTQHGREHPISADLTHDGDRLTGKMRDEVPNRERSISEMALEEGLEPGADERIVAHLRQVLPETPPGPILAESHLAPDSTLEGEVTGRVLRFVKTYQGASFTGFRIGDVRLGQVIEGHQVHYRGVLSESGLEIEGQWWIPPTQLGPGLLTPRTEGGFLLRRHL